MSDCNFTEHKHFNAKVMKIRTTPPYPFTTVCGDVWKCKIILKWWDTHEDGTRDEFRYIAYPTMDSDCFNEDGNKIPCCKVQEDGWAYVHTVNKPNSPNKGQIIKLVETYDHGDKEDE